MQYLNYTTTVRYNMTMFFLIHYLLYLRLRSLAPEKIILLLADCLPRSFVLSTLAQLIACARAHDVSKKLLVVDRVVSFK